MADYQEEQRDTRYCGAPATYFIYKPQFGQCEKMESSVTCQRLLGPSPNPAA
jgi:hypothetical protein